MGLMSRDAAMRVEGVGGGTSVEGENLFVVRGELGLTSGGVGVVGGRSCWRDEGKFCIGAGGSNCLSLDFSIAAEGRGGSKGYGSTDPFLPASV